MSFRPDFDPAGRAAPACPHRPPCPGCPSLGRAAADLPIIARLAAHAAQAAAGFAVAQADSPVGYRHRARLAVRGRAGSPKVGIFQAGSHRIADIPRCLVHHPHINHVTAEVRHAIKATGLAPYADGPHRGLIRYLQLMVAPEDGRIQLVVVTNDVGPESAMPLFEHLRARLSTQLDGLFWNGQPERSNRILGPHFRRIAGPEALATWVGPTRVFFPPDAFSQNNPATYARIADQVDAWLPDAGRVLELYAGVGALGLRVLPRQHSVTFNELADGSLRGLSMGVAQLPQEQSARARVLPGRAGDMVHALADASAVIVDPPRKGLDPGLAEAIAATDSVAHLVYVSCGPESFLTDAAALTATGRLRLAELRVFDLFPWTGHVEVVALFVATR